jgi:hypothetical protein
MRLAVIAMVLSFFSVAVYGVIAKWQQAQEERRIRVSLRDGERWRSNVSSRGLK